MLQPLKKPPRYAKPLYKPTADETIAVRNLLPAAALTPDTLKQAAKLAAELVQAMRQSRKKNTGLMDFLHQYNLSARKALC